MTQHEQNDPIAVFNLYEKAINAGDIDAVMALFDDNVTTSALIAQQWPEERAIESIRQYILQSVIRNSGKLQTIKMTGSTPSWNCTAT